MSTKKMIYNTIVMIVWIWAVIVFISIVVFGESLQQAISVGLGGGIGAGIGVFYILSQSSTKR